MTTSLREGSVLTQPGGRDAVPRFWLLSETSNAAQRQVRDHFPGDQAVRMVVAPSPPARPQAGGLAQGKLNVENEIVTRDGAKVVVHDVIMKVEHNQNKCAFRHQDQAMP